MAWGAALACVPWVALAADPPGEPTQRRQATQLEHSDARDATPVLTAVPAAGDARDVVVAETPCFVVSNIDWRGAEAFPWLAEEAEPVLGRCLGAKSLRNLRDHLTRALLARGLIASRIVYPPGQNLAAGTLAVEAMAGRLARVAETGRSVGWLAPMLAVRTGAPVNQRDLDQTLENLRMLGGQAGARIELVPGEALGETDLRIVHGDGGGLNGSVGTDDSGSRATGKAQVSARIGIDSPLGLYDSLDLSYSTNADRASKTHASRAASAQWRVPLGYAQATLAVSGTRYRQTVAGFNGPILYTGYTRSQEAGLGYVPYRGGSFKGDSRLAFFHREAKNFIDRAEVGVQTRDYLGLEIGHAHRHFAGPWTLTGGATLRGSLPGISKNPGIVVGEPDWDGGYLLGIVTASAGRAFGGPNGSWRVQTQLRWQEAGIVPPNEYVSLGGRYSVRGFAGEETLAGESGGNWRNEVAWAFRAARLPGAHELWFALDAGRIAGRQNRGLDEKTLAGAALGVRGGFPLAAKFGLNYDLGFGYPLVRPSAFRDEGIVIAASIGIDFRT